jgi:hypothetical protein
VWFWQHWNLNLGLNVCKGCALPLEPLQHATNLQVLESEYSFIHSYLTVLGFELRTLLLLGTLPHEPLHQPRVLSVVVVVMQEGSSDLIHAFLITLYGVIFFVQALSFKMDVTNREAAVVTLRFFFFALFIVVNYTYYKIYCLKTFFSVQFSGITLIIFNHQCHPSS